MMSDSRLAREQANAFKEIELPLGKVLKLSDCEKLELGLDRDSCALLFVEGTRGRAGADGKAGSECEKKRISDYQSLIGEEEDQGDWNIEESDNGNEGASSDSDGAGGKP
jgi:hypothetical protein